MTQKAIFYHAGCPVCVAAENRITEIIDRGRVDLEIVHLGDMPGRIDEAEAVGVKSVPALVIDGAALHINHGADLSALR
ncbi:MAG: thioredoxin family protein [Rhizobiaceae bacterium]|nr:thioredoxin family protein [Rhizobiaceae bacterium]